MAQKIGAEMHGIYVGRAQTRVYVTQACFQFAYFSCLYLVQSLYMLSSLNISTEQHPISLQR